jgi:cell division protein FtsQ
LRGNFFTINLEQTRQAFESIPWVRKVNIRRHFPWQLEIGLEEHVALAHWNNTDLVSTHGEIFSARTNEQLPKFIGQPDSAVEMVQMFTTLTTKLAPLKQEITEIDLSPRRSWRLRLSSGMQLELGREQTVQRLTRFVAVYPHSLMPIQQNHELLRPGKTQHQIAHVDLRYSNGYAAYLSDTTNSLKMTGEKAM